MLFDSHAHLDDKAFDADREEIISSLLKDDVSYVVNIGADYESSVNSVALANKYDFIYASVGVHPYDAASVDDDMIQKLRSLAQDKKVVAIGETGLDYHYEGFDRQVQKRAFVMQANLADSLNMPVIIHNRESTEDTINILKEIRPESVIIHCYSGSIESAKILLDMGYYISFSGTVTFKNAKKLKEVAKYVPDDRLLIETDCPYLSPEPERGTRNHSGKIIYTARHIAELRGCDFDKIAEITMANARRVYGI
jgi:TatD DNase family protein